MKHFSRQVLTTMVDLTILDGQFTITSTSGTLGSVVGNEISAVSHAATGETGQFKVVLHDKFNKLIDIQACVQCSAFSNVATIEILEDNVAASGTFTMQCYDLSGAAVDPAESAVVKFVAMVKQSGIDRAGE